MPTPGHKDTWRLVASDIPYPKTHADAPDKVDIYRRVGDSQYYMYYRGHPNVYYIADQAWAHFQVLNQFNSEFRKAEGMRQ